jgi:hypothetical protein
MEYKHKATRVTDPNAIFPGPGQAASSTVLRAPAPAGERPAPAIVDEEEEDREDDQLGDEPDDDDLDDAADDIEPPLPAPAIEEPALPGWAFGESLSLDRLVRAVSMKLSLGNASSFFQAQLSSVSLYDETILAAVREGTRQSKEWEAYLNAKALSESPNEKVAELKLDLQRLELDRHELLKGKLNGKALKGEKLATEIGRVAGEIRRATTRSKSMDAGMDALADQAAEARERLKAVVEGLVTRTVLPAKQLLMRKMDAIKAKALAAVSPYLWDLATLLFVQQLSPDAARFTQRFVVMLAREADAEARKNAKAEPEAEADADASPGPDAPDTEPAE